jgi:pyruvate/2-oxoglutarate dehydrogenase complex dihydrolipoamide acyltransferase (E2) component
MSFEFRLPDLGEGMAEVEVISWHVSEGDDVTLDQPLLTVETDKLITDLPSPVAGRILELRAALGDKVPVGQTLLLIDAAGTLEAPSTNGMEQTVGAMASPSSAESSPPAAVPTGAPPPRRARVRAAPAVRKLAVDLGVDLAGLSGTGPERRITRDDVLAASSGDSPALGDPSPGLPTAPDHPGVTNSDGGPPTEREGPYRRGERYAMSAIRRRIAANLVESWTRIPQCVDFREVDATRLIETRAAIVSGEEVLAPVSFVALMVKFAAEALIIHPLFNAKLDDAQNEIVIDKSINIGIATATADGILVPVLRNADQKSLTEIAAEVDSLADRARTRRLTASELQGGTFTVNNIGALNPDGGAFPTPLINWPETAILGFGRIADRVVAVDGSPAVRPVMMLTVTADHRLVDGAEVAAFTNSIVRFIREPGILVARLR